MPEEPNPQAEPQKKKFRRGRYMRPSLKAIRAKAAEERAKKNQRVAERKAKAAQRKAEAEERLKVRNERLKQKLGEEEYQRRVREYQEKLEEDRKKAEVEELIRSGKCEPIYQFPLGPGDNPDRRTLEAKCFQYDWPVENGGLGAFGHFRNFAALSWPDLVWNEWLEHQIKSLCEPEYGHEIGDTRLRFVNWTGCGAAGKTFAAGLFACAWFAVDPFRSSVTLTSTSKTIIGQRVWPVIQKFWSGARDPVTHQRLHWGHMVNSRKMVEAVKGDEKHSICALAVEPGDLMNSLDRIKGRHTERMMLVVDEANTTPAAIFECIPNMQKGCEEFILVVIGNAVSRLDNHGRCCEPRRGWRSITIDDNQWETKGVPEWNMDTGICCHFDGEKSPNVRAGRTLHPWIYTYENYIADQRRGKESPQYWSQTRGFWPPEGIINTVFTETMIERFDAKGKFTFLSKRTPISFMDTAFGGDRCVITYGYIGDLPDGRLAVQLGEQVEVKVSVREKHEIDYQMAHAFIAGNKQRGIRPEHAGLDATGTGRGVAAIVMQEWSDQVNYIEWGGKASEKPASIEDPRPSHEIYWNRVTELWYSCRELLCSGLLKGLNHETIIEFTTRLFELKARKVVLETKEDMRARLHRSPDLADSVSGLCEVARRNGVTAGGQERPVSWEDLAEVKQEEKEEDFSLQALDEEITPTTEMEWSYW